MDHWGNSMLSAVEILSQMVAVGLGMSKNEFIKKIHGGPHLLAPTVNYFYNIRLLVTLYYKFYQI